MKISQAIQNLSKPNFIDIEKICSVEDHGRYLARKYEGADGWTECPRCNREKEEKEREDEKKRIYTNKCMRAGIPPLYMESTFENYQCWRSQKQRDVVRQAKNYIENFPKKLEQGISVIISGKPGTGKTHVACAIAKGCIDRGYKVLFRPAFNFLQELKEDWNEVLKKIQYYTEYDLLVIDDIGKHMRTDTDTTFLHNIISERCNNKKITLITANHSCEAIKKMIGEAAYDRLAGSLILTMDWESYRGTHND